MPQTISAPAKSRLRAATGSAPPDRAQRPARRQRRSWLPSPGLAVFLFLLSLYALTAGGHTYSYDEETMFALTEGLVERGSIVIPTCSGCPILRSSPPREGVNYSRYGPLPSLAATPFYLVGRAVAGEDGAARWFLTRFAATLLNAVVTAGTGALLYRFARDLGYGARAALATALLYGVGTQAWPHARTFFSEPLTALLILGAVYCWWRLDGARGEGRGAKGEERGAESLPAYPPSAFRLPPSILWAAGLGACGGLALATKVGAGIALPLLGLAGAATLWRLWRGGRVTARGALAIGASAAMALAVPVALVGWYNVARFGSPWETGYGAREVGAIQDGDFWRGLRGLLISPGKSIFLFSPVVALALPGWWPFARRHGALALVSGALALVHLLFYARVPYWHGDTAWGPRYLDFVLPLLALPLAAGVDWLGGRGTIARRALLGGGAAVVALALVVQALGLLVNFDTGFNAVRTGNRHFDARNSPVLAHARILGERMGAWREARFPGEPGITPGRGFAALTEDDPLWPRFLPHEATLRVRAEGDGAVTGALVYQDARERREPPQRLAILVNGRPVGERPEAPAPDAGEPAAYRILFPIRAEGDAGDLFVVTIRNEAFDELGPSRLLSFGATAGGEELPARRRPLILPFPDDTPGRFAWFLTERNRHLVDLWPWYVAVLKLPAGLSRALVVGFGGAAVVGLAVGAAGLVAAWRRGGDGGRGRLAG